MGVWSQPKTLPADRAIYEGISLLRLGNRRLHENKNPRRNPTAMAGGIGGSHAPYARGTLRRAGTFADDPQNAWS